MESKKDSPEAIEWLRNNKNPFALAANRFKDTGMALDFVEKLYQTGAVRVCVDNIDERHTETDGGPYADSLIVEVPNDPQQRAELFEIFAEEAKREDFEPTEDTGQNEVLLWWD